jgi:hypothetical protein
LGVFFFLTFTVNSFLAGEGSHEFIFKVFFSKESVFWAYKKAGKLALCSQINPKFIKKVCVFIPTIRLMQKFKKVTRKNKQSI